jgi:stress response protein YsnF
MEVQMKTSKIKGIAIATMLLMACATGWSKNPPGDVMMANFPREHAAINNDLDRIQQHRGEIRCLKSELKSDRRAGYDMDVATDKRELRRARMALCQAKTQLREDKAALKEQYRHAIRTREEQIHAMKKAERSAKMDVEKTKRYGNAASIARDAEYAERTAIQHDAAVVSLAEFKDERKVDLVAVNENIRESRPMVAGIIPSRNRDAYAGNCVVR